MKQGRTEDSNRKVSGIVIQRGESPPAPQEIWDKRTQPEPFTRLHNPEQPAQPSGPFPWSQSSGPGSQSSLHSTAQGGCCSRWVCFHLQLEVWVAQKPTHQHGPAAKHVVEPWHGSRARSSRAVCYSTATDQPTLTSHGKSGGGAHRSALSIPYITFTQHRLCACPVVLSLEKAHS